MPKVHRLLILAGFGLPYFAIMKVIIKAIDKPFNLDALSKEIEEVRRAEQ